MRRRIVGIIFLLLLTGVGKAHAQPLQQDNLLTNPSFEQPFEEYFRDDGGGFIAHGWSPWWNNDAGDELDGPEFKQANINVDPNRVRSGLDAQQYFRPWARHEAGFYQRVQVPANSTVRYTIYGHAWSSFCVALDGGLDCDARNSFHGEVNPIFMKVGIDPTGGTQWSSGSIVWSESKSVYDNWDLFQVDATAQGEFVTVFVYSSPLYPAPVVNVYWDDAALVVTSGGDSQPEENQSTDTSNTDNSNSGSTNTGGGIGAIATQAPREDGSQWHVVQSGETLGGIAFAYGVTAQNIRDLNALTSDIVRVGQELLIKPAGSEQPEPQPTEEEVVEEEAPPAAAEEPPAEEQSAGAICVLLFEDANLNGLRDEEETLIANGTMNLSGVMSDSYTTDGVSEPHCFSNLDSGDYVTSATPPEGYHLTGLAELPVTITGGGQIELNFGVVPSEETAPGEAAKPAEEEADTAPTDGSPLRTFLIIAGIVVVVALAVGGGLAAYFLIYKRKATI